MFAEQAGGGFSGFLLEQYPQRVVLRFDGAGVEQFFAGESGGHRWQQASGKAQNVHTSTITVAVLPVIAQETAALREQDLEWDKPFCAGGPGGQHQNKTASACRVRHKKTGIAVESRTERSLHQNKRLALELLAARVAASASKAAAHALAKERKQQVGSGQRGDKIRTYREKDDLVVDEATGRKILLSKLIRGDWQGLK